MVPSPIFDLANRYIDESAALDPCTATGRGIPGYDHLLTDYSPTASPNGSATRAGHWPN